MGRGVIYHLIHLPISSGWKCSWHTEDKGSSVVKNLPGKVGDMDSIPELGRSPGGENGNPLQDSCLGKPMDGGVWWATVHGIAKSQTQLSMHTQHIFAKLNEEPYKCVYPIPCEKKRKHVTK